MTKSQGLGIGILPIKHQITNQQFNNLNTVHKNLKKNRNFADAKPKNVFARISAGKS